MASINPKLHNSEISKLLGYTWKLLPDEDKRPFIDQAKKLKEIHNSKYPNYKYKPTRKRKSIALNMASGVSNTPR